MKVVDGVPMNSVSSINTTINCPVGEEMFIGGLVSGPGMDTGGSPGMGGGGIGSGGLGSGGIGRGDLGSGSLGGGGISLGDLGGGGIGGDAVHIQSLTGFIVQLTRPDPRNDTG